MTNIPKYLEKNIISKSINFNSDANYNRSNKIC